ncbi:MAG: hypothetical protein CFE21_01110 [Bacteroidetes bacterium B1(2017)]|nr:MAG: hypothetical protein CFE21_01110 [Bacteroidetes bacterium B1(2017)]
MKFSLFPKETSLYESEFDILELIEILKENTLNGMLSSTNYQTNKKFIGSIEQESFKIISSAKKTSLFCVFEGQKANVGKQISIVKKFHPIFRNLFILWFVSILIVILFPPFEPNEIIEIFLFVSFATILRYVLIKVLFDTAKTEGIKRLSDLLKLSEIK